MNKSLEETVNREPAAATTAEAVGSRQSLVYAVAYEVYTNDRRLVPHIDYLKAYNEANAKFLFLSHQPRNRNLKIVGISRVIGYHAHDDHGDNLSLDGERQHGKAQEIIEETKRFG